MAELQQENDEVCDSTKCVCTQIERQRILSAVDKLRPYIDEQGQPNWFRHAAYVRVIQEGK